MAFDTQRQGGIMERASSEPWGWLVLARRQAMARKLTVGVLIAALAASTLSCTPTQQGATIGAVTGAGAGYALDRHHRTRGAAVGAVAGGIIGGVIGYTYEINKFCPNCGRRFHDSRVYCPYDGAPLQQVR